MLYLRIALALGLVAGAPGSAWAHGSFAGLNHFYSGLLHPLLAPAHLMSVLALALWAGQSSLSPRPHALLGLIAGLLGGMSLASLAGEPDTDRPLYLLAVLAAAAAASGLKAQGWVRASLGLLIGLAIGLGSGDAKLHDIQRLGALSGSFAGALLLASLVAVGVEALVVQGQRAWARIALRILASWLCAVALMLFGLSLRN